MIPLKSAAGSILGATGNVRSRHRQSGQEIRNWIAAYAALSTVGPYDITYRYYRPIPEFIAGFSITTALPRNAGPV